MTTSNGKLSPRTLLYILKSIIGVPDEAFQAAKFAKGQDPKTHAPVKCAVCQTPTTECCVGCSNVVYFTDLTADRTYYCKKACQEQGWQKHKEECKKTRALVNQQTLQRAATLMQQAFYTFRLMSFDLSFKSLKWSENTLVLKEGAYEFFDILADFPDELTLNESQQTKQILLTMTSCSDTLISFHRVCVLFLKDAGMTKKIEEVPFLPKPGPRAWIFHGGDSTSHTTSHGKKSSRNFTLRVILVILRRRDNDIARH
ncbi:hypothetical protein LTR64_008394 [Lithohypha guttulata]|uniref:uncharacterized protein n=1 Tax=Lithohypha guttulata TaxID=1690604 RepID=UPI00315D901D